MMKKAVKTNKEGEEGKDSEQNKTAESESMKEIPEFTKKEMQDAIDRIERGNASDSNGIRADDIKECDEETKEMMRPIFNEIIKHKECTLQTWQIIRIKVIFEKRAMWKMQAITAQFVQFQLCTNYSRHCFTPGCT